MISELQKDAADRYMSATTVVLLLYSIVVRYDERILPSRTPLELIYKPLFSDLRVSHLLPL